MEKIFGLTRPRMDSPLFEFYSDYVRLDIFIEYFLVIVLIAILVFGIPYLIIRLAKPNAKTATLLIFGHFLLKTFGMMIISILFFAFIAPIIFFIKNFILQILPDLPALFGLILVLPLLGAFVGISWPFYVISYLQKNRKNRKNN